jgi:hypothetical protein
MHTGGQCERRPRVPQVVQPDRRQACSRGLLGERSGEPSIAARRAVAAGARAARRQCPSRARRSAGPSLSWVCRSEHRGCPRSPSARSMRDPSSGRRRPSAAQGTDDLHRWVWSDSGRTCSESITSAERDVAPRFNQSTQRPDREGYGGGANARLSRLCLGRLTHKLAQSGQALGQVGSFSVAREGTVHVPCSASPVVVRTPPARAIILRPNPTIKHWHISKIDRLMLNRA